MSHPTMGAWIEIINRVKAWCSPVGRTPRWVRGLKSVTSVNMTPSFGRTPRWVRGLKSSIVTFPPLLTGVAPHDGCVD